MKLLISFLFLFHSSVYACALCAIFVPHIKVDTQIFYDDNKTSFDIQWHFEETFVNSLMQYDLNKNAIFEKDEQTMIKESLVTYLKDFRYLTDIEYKKTLKLTKPKFIQNIEPTFSELVFVNNTMIYHYKFELPFSLKNKYSLYLGFNDIGGNFDFILRNLTLNNYEYAYSIEKTPLYLKVNLNDPHFIESKEIVKTSTDTNFSKKSITENTPQKTETSYMKILSENLSKLQENLKALLSDIKQKNNVTSYLWLFFFSFLYGILHAIGPGHGKSLVSSYFLNQEKSYLKALSVSSLIGIVHTFSAFLLTLVVYNFLGFIFNSAIVNVEQIATKVSAVIIIGIALYLILKKFKKTQPSFTFSSIAKPSNILSPKVTHSQTLNCGCNGCKTTGTDLGIILAAGIVPCPGTVTIFLFTMSLGIYFVGFISAVFMSIGMSLIIFITATISVKIRKKNSKNTSIIKFFEYFSLFFILCLGVFLLLV